MNKAKICLFTAGFSIVLALILANNLSAADDAQLRDGIYSPKGNGNSNSMPVAPVLTPQTLPPVEKIRKDKWTAYKMAKVIWLDKVAQANPQIIEAICSHPGAAKILAQHRHLDKIAEADHYLCRRLCRWRGATEKLLRNKYCDKVIALDPQGMYLDLKNHPKDARLLTKSTMFNQMIDENPDLGKELSKHMY